MATTFRQELPPKGGYEKINYKRAIPKRGPSGYLLLGGVTAFCFAGFLRLAQVNRYRRRVQREEREARIAIHPLIEAERDRDYLKVLKYNREQEAIIMKDVPGWVVGESPYHTKRWIEPHLEDLYFLNEDVRHLKKFGFAAWV
ncbi:NADH dehydrogenase [ubiquinone] 1 alpha subcomplex subunit 13-like [Amphiura filiformis]|uniref:NADH dehydrogenase [ubiquinone] 1 alpha subcomplex subunit 13-like n=1 Tax=Amphiura filiformis TaxID=82378 RepID=UPI003B21318A